AARPGGPGHRSRRPPAGHPRDLRRGAVHRHRGRSGHHRSARSTRRTSRRRPAPRRQRRARALAARHPRRPSPEDPDMTTTLERDFATLAARDLDPPSPYEPFTVEAHHPPPLASIDPDPSKGWIRRMAPVLMARRGLFLTAMGISLISMVTQIAVPRVVMEAIDTALPLTLPDGTVVAAERSLEPFIWALLALAAVRAAGTLTFRLFLFKVAYGLEYDLRVTMYQHLARMDFSFFDRVQSGQLISRANSDIRSVQMFLTFAPMMGLQLVSFALAFALMLSIHVPLTIVALLPLPFVFVIGLRMRSFMFPISWIVQSRTADVATIVEENVTGTRVVKSFAAEEQQVNQLAAAADRLRWATTKQIDLRATYAPIMENLPR